MLADAPAPALPLAPPPHNRLILLGASGFPGLPTLADSQAAPLMRSAELVQEYFSARMGVRSALHLFDLKEEKSRPIPVRVAADLPGVRPRLEKLAKHVHKAGLSPTGARALFDPLADELVEVAMPDAGVLMDVDTPEALAAIRTGRSSGS